MSKYNIKITKIFSHTGYPETMEDFLIEGLYFKGTVRYFGNHGFDIPQISHIRVKNNGYFWSSKAFMKFLYNDKLRECVRGMKVNESITIEVEG